MVALFHFSFQEGVKTENDHINLKVAGQDGSVVQFKIKRHTPLCKLMKAYCERQVRVFMHMQLHNLLPKIIILCLGAQDYVAIFANKRLVITRMPGNNWS